MLKAKSQELAIVSSVLKMVRKVSGAAFNEKLDDYSLSFSTNKKINMLTMNLLKGEDFCEAFKEEWAGNTPFFQAPFPSTFSDIERFEKQVEKGLAQVFEFVKGDK